MKTVYGLRYWLHPPPRDQRWRCDLMMAFKKKEALKQLAKIRVFVLSLSGSGKKAGENEGCQCSPTWRQDK